MGKKQLDLIGKRFGLLTIIEELQPHRYPNGTPRRKFKFLCDCGNTAEITINLVKSGNTKSCGCVRKKIASMLKYSHGLRRHGCYSVWQNIKDRCYNPKSEFYSNYGGKGIEVCDEWKEFINFHNWAVANGYETTPNPSIERKDISKDYCPANCKFIPYSEQANNRTNTIWITICGERKNLMQWCNQLNIIYDSAYQRFRRGLCDAEILLIY